MLAPSPQLAPAQLQFPVQKVPILSPCKGTVVSNPAAALKRSVSRANEELRQPARIFLRNRLTMFAKAPAAHSAALAHPATSRN